MNRKDKLPENTYAPEWEQSLLGQIGSVSMTPNNGVWVLAPCRNELDRLPAFLEHHRRLGISGFVFVDNDSIDGSREYLASQDDTIVLNLPYPFATYKSKFRAMICDQLFVDSWVLFLDCDELLYYPNLEQRDIKNYVSGLEAGGFDAVIGMMVDSYPLKSEFGTEFEIDKTRIFFDGKGYWATKVLNQSRKVWKTPAFNLFGGASTRLFFTHQHEAIPWIDRLLMAASLNFVGVTSDQPLLFLKVQNWISRRLRRYERSEPVTPPKQNKICLLRWKKGTEFQSSAHRVNFAYRCSPHRTCLVHLKFFGDFARRVSFIAKSGTHANQSEIYRHIAGEFSEREDWLNRLHFRHTRELKSSKNLYAAGLFGRMVFHR